MIHAKKYQIFTWWRTVAGGRYQKVLLKIILKSREKKEKKKDIPIWDTDSLRRTTPSGKNTLISFYPEINDFFEYLIGVVDVDVVVLRWWKKQNFGCYRGGKEKRYLTALHPFEQKVTTIHTPRKLRYFGNWL